MNENQKNDFEESSSESDNSDMLNQDKIIQQAAQIAAENRPMLDAFRIACSSLFEITVESKEQPFVRKPPIGLRFRIGTSFLALVAPRFDYRTKTVLCDRQILELLVLDQLEENGTKFFKHERQLTLSLSASGNSFTSFYPKTLKQDAAQLFVGIKQFLDSPSRVLENSERCAVCGRVLADGLSKARGVGPECIERVGKWGFYTSHSVFNAVVPLQRDLLVQPISQAREEVEDELDNEIAEGLLDSPESKTKQVAELENLGEDLDSYIDPTSPEFDAIFARELIEFRPDWLSQQEIDAVNAATRDT